MKKKKIAILRFGAIGDIIHSLPFLFMLKESIKNVEITYITANSTYLINLLKAVPCIDKVIGVDLSFNFNINAYSKLKAAIDTIKKSNFDMFFNLHPSWKTKLFCEMAKQKEVYTYKSNDNTTNEHVWKNFAKTYFNKEQIENFNLNSCLPLIRPSKQTSEKLFETMPFYNSKKKLIGLIPFVGFKRTHKAWDLEYWVSLIKIIASQHEIILFGGRDSGFNAEIIMSKINTAQIPVHNLTGKLTLLETAMILSKMDIIVGADTGPTHLAGAMKTKTLALFGPTNKDRHSPFYGKSLRSTYNCGLGCSEKKCTQKINNNCMSHLTPIFVYNQIQEALN